jgi:hypothetical protein
MSFNFGSVCERNRAFSKEVLQGQPVAFYVLKEIIIPCVN